jgi:hypothetical protein
MRLPLFVFVAIALAGCSAPQPPVAGTLTVSSTAFADQGAIPRVHTCQGDNTQPPITIQGVPSATVALAMIMDDPDAPSGTFTHWTFWDLPPGQTTISSGDATTLGAIEGNNGAGRIGYTGPCPPSGTHRYMFKAYALSAKLNLPRGAEVEQVQQALQGKVLAQGTLMGTYAKT